MGLVIFAAMVVAAVILIAAFNSRRAGPSQDQPSTHEDLTFDPHVKISTSVHIQYKDAKGTPSNRQVDVKSFQANIANGTFIGYCHNKMASRTFRFDRVLRAADADTGEIITNLQGHLREILESSPQYALNRVFKSHRPQLRMLLYVAKADGVLSATEISVIGSYVRRVTMDDRLDDKSIRLALRELREMTPSSFQSNYKKLQKSSVKDAALIASACRQIVATGRKVHPTEQAVLDILPQESPLAIDGCAPSENQECATQ